MKDVMIATSNKGKVKEFKEMLQPLGYCVHDLSEIDPIEIEENGNTFAQNALIKARAPKVDMMVIADDSGLCVKYKDWGPGIYSARYLEGHDYTYKNNHLLNEMKDVSDREAKFCCAIALIDEQGEHVFEGVLHGDIAYEIRGEGGFGYDPIFIPKGYNQTNAELGNAIKNQISHRAIATQKLLEYLKKEK